MRVNYINKQKQTKEVKVGFSWTILLFSFIALFVRRQTIHGAAILALLIVDLPVSYYFDQIGRVLDLFTLGYIIYLAVIGNTLLEEKLVSEGYVKQESK